MTDQTSNLIFKCWSSNVFFITFEIKRHTLRKKSTWLEIPSFSWNIPKWMEIKLTLFFWRTGVVGTGLLAFPSNTLRRLRPFFRCAAAEDNLELLEPRLETSSGKSSSGAWPRGRVKDGWGIPMIGKMGVWYVFTRWNMKACFTWCQLAQIQSENKGKTSIIVVN